MTELTEAEQARLAQIGAWMVQTCLLFGAQRSTAYKVAGVFVEALEQEWRLREPTTATQNPPQ